MMHRWFMLFDSAKSSFQRHRRLPFLCVFFCTCRTLLLASHCLSAAFPSLALAIYRLGCLLSAREAELTCVALRSFTIDCWHLPIVFDLTVPSSFFWAFFEIRSISSHYLQSHIPSLGFSVSLSPCLSLYLRYFFCVALIFDRNIFRFTISFVHLSIHFFCSSSGHTNGYTRYIASFRCIQNNNILVWINPTIELSNNNKNRTGKISFFWICTNDNTDRAAIKQKAERNKCFADNCNKDSGDRKQNIVDTMELFMCKLMMMMILSALFIRRFCKQIAFFFQCPSLWIW